MSRPRKAVPSYSEHKSSGQARVRVNGRDIYLGKFKSPESKAEYRRICAELEATPSAAPALGRGLTVNEVAERYALFARGHYRDEDGNPTTEIGWLKDSLPPVIQLYGDRPAAEFGPLALKAVRNVWVKGGIVRTSINSRVNRVRRMFKWAASEELVPVTVHQALTTVTGLQKGRTDAEESDPVEPVPDDDIDAVVAVALPTMAAMIRTMRLTGMRPTEVCRMKAGDIDRTRSPWVYSPKRHKTKYRGKHRAVLIGPKAQEVLAPLLAGTDPDAPVFSPARLTSERNAAKRKARKSKVQPSQQHSRAKAAKLLKRKKPVAFGRKAFGDAVRLLCVKAGVPHWHPNQIRHTFATEVRRVYGVEAAQVLLGHARADVTQVYAERDMGLAARVAGEIG